MRRRLSIAMAVMVAGALLLAGSVLAIVTVRDTRSQTRVELVREAQGLAVSVRQGVASDPVANPAVRLRSILATLKSTLRLEGVAVLGVRPDGRIFDPLTPRKRPHLPSGLTRADLSPTELLGGRTVSGVAGPVVFAAVPYRAEIQVLGRPRNVLQVVILTRRPPTGLANAGPWFLGAAVLIMVIALGVARRLGRRIVRPVEAVELTARRIAAGDLTARVPEPPATDPELASLVASINTMTESLARARGAERQFLLSVSHDLRTPLTSIRGFAEAIEDGVTADTVRAASVIAAESRRLERLVGDLLDLAKLEARRFSLDLSVVDLGDVAHATADGFAPAASELGLDLTSSGPGQGVVRVRGDPDRLGQVVANLIENALKYARTAVVVGYAASGTSAALWVDDDGPGIAAEDLPRVFEGLYASRRRPGRQVGSGLGLAIVAELVGAMGGSVRAESPVGVAGGTRVVVTLPVA